ncbi:MAG: glycosyltransferase WbuB [Synergistales bacterium]|nr:glycosyltransferase WbuB [Synergistales bacterium]
MKILIICQYFYPERFRVNDISFELVKNGHDVTVLTGLPNYPSGVVETEYRRFRKRAETINGVRVRRSWLLGRGKGSLRLALNYLSFAFSSMIKALSIEKDFDLILVYQLSPVTMALPGILLKKLTGKPLILYCHDLWPESLVSGGIAPSSAIYRTVLRLSRWIYSKADHIFTSSSMFSEYFKEILKVDKLPVHLPVYAEALFEDIPPAQSDKETLDLLFAGNVGELQSVETIIRAAAELKDQTHIRFHIVGDGSALNKCKKTATDLKVENVLFHGQHPLEEMPRFYALADAFVVTLTKNKAISYTLPNKVQSYLAAGKPILGAIDGETRALIENSQCGLCAPAEDYHQLAVLIRKFSKEKEKMREYGENARRCYDRAFSKEKYMGRLTELLHTIAYGSDVQHVHE